MTEPHDPNRTVEVSSVPVDALDAGLAAGFGRAVEAPRSSLDASQRPVLLREAKGESDHVVKPNSDAMPPRSATGDRYQLYGEIARGGMGAVLRGRDMDLGRDLAVKVLLEKHADRPEVARRFIEEAQIGGQLQHPGVVPVYDIGRFGERPFFTMKLVKGQTLAALLSERSDPAADRPRLLSIALQVTQALAYAHAKGVIHRDLKPANVMVGAFGEVQVMDWGLAKVLAEGGVADEDRASGQTEAGTLIRTARSSGTAASTGTDTEAGALLGTPAYMPPEQANGDVANLDRRADVFGLGAILCEVLTGKPPYLGRSAEEVQRKAANGDLADAHARLAGCGADAELVALTSACLSPEARDRPRDAQAVANALTAYLDGVQEQLHQAELAGAAARARAEEEAKRRRLTVALAATVLLALTLGGGGWLWLKADRDARQAALSRDVNEALNRITALREKAKASPVGSAALFAQAREQAQRALALVQTGPADPALAARVRQLQTELNEEEKDRQLLAALDAARLAQAEAQSGENRFPFERAVPLFRVALRTYGLAAGEGEPGAAAERVRQRPAAVREAIAATLDEWIDLAANPSYKLSEPHLDWLKAVAAAAEPEDGWTRQFQAARQEKDSTRRRQALEKLAEAADVRKLPARALARLASRLRSERAWASAVRLLRRAREQHPADFWVNQYLGMSLLGVAPPEREEAVRFLTVAVSLRPDSPGAHVNLGTALRAMGRQDEEIARLRKALEFDPRLAMAHNILGNALQRKGQLDEAIACYHQALKLDPKLANAYSNLGAALRAKGQLDEAIACYHQALEIDPKLAMAHTNLGITLNDKGLPDEAIVCYRKALELDPKSANAHNILGNALQRKGQLDEAIACYHQALKLDPKLANAHINLGVALRSKGRLDEAIACYHQALKLDPKLANAHTNLGIALNDKGLLDEAIACYRKALELDPKQAKNHYNLGNTLAAKSQMDEAIACYRKALQLDPKLANAHTNLGNALKAKGRLDEAIDSYRKAIQLDPKEAKAHYRLGNALKAKGRLDEAIACYHQAIKLDPKDAAAHNNLGLALLAKGQLDEAIACYRKAIQLDPKDAAAYVNLGTTLSDKGRLDEAIACFRKAIELDPKLAMAHNNLGLALAAKGRLDEAIACWRQALALDPKLALAHNNLGTALKAKGRLDEAINSYRKAVEFDPKYAVAHVNLGLTLGVKGRLDEASACFRKAVELDPNNAAAHAYLGYALAATGQLDEAIASYRKALKLDPKQALALSNLMRAERLAAARDKLRAFQDGSYTPATRGERLALVEWCQFKKLHNTVAGLYAAAFAADPKLADDLDAGHRYNAACSAAQAAAGKGEDAAKLDDKERARLRKQALDWLRADLAAYANLLESGTPAASARVQRQMRHWQQATDLAGIRDAAALAKLAEEEQKGFTQLWADVAALLKKAEAPANKETPR